MTTKLLAAFAALMAAAPLPTAARAQTTVPQTPGSQTYTFKPTRQAPMAAYLGFGWVIHDDARPVVTEVRDGSPAAAAGMRTGDVIMAIDGHDTTVPGRMFRDATPGRRYAVRLDRGGQMIDTVVVAAPLPRSPGTD